MKAGRHGLPAGLPARRPAGLQAYLPAILPVCLPACLLDAITPGSCWPTVLPTGLPSCRPAFRRACRPAFLPTSLPAYLPACLLSRCQVFYPLPILPAFLPDHLIDLIFFVCMPTCRWLRPCLISFLGPSCLPACRIAFFNIKHLFFFAVMPDAASVSFLFSQIPCAVCRLPDDSI